MHIDKFNPTLFLLGLSLLFVGQVKCQSKHSDTLFLQIDSIYGKAQSVYILNANSKSRESENYFKLAEGQTYVNTSITDVKVGSFEHFKQLPPWTKWVPLHIYKGQYYTYNPCDGYFDFGISLTDSSKVDWTGEGPCLLKTISLEKTDNLTYKINSSNGNANEETTIHIIDKKRGIAVFETISRKLPKEDVETSYRLMVAVDQMHLFPVIVNHCSIEKAFEWEFDQVNYKTLLNQ